VESKYVSGIISRLGSCGGAKSFQQSGEIQKREKKRLFFARKSKLPRTRGRRGEYKRKGGERQGTLVQEGKRNRFLPEPGVKWGTQRV